MTRRDPERAEARLAVGASSLAAAVLVVALIAGASVAGAALLAFVPLAIAAAALYDAWRRSVARRAALQEALEAAHDDVTRAGARRAAAEAEVASLREAAEQHDAAHREAEQEARRREDEARARAEEEAERHRGERDRLQDALRRAEDALRDQRRLAQRLARSRRAEREWNRELRGQIQHLYDVHRRRTPDGPADVRELVLQTAMRLVEARKGMLLSHEDADRDGALDVVVAYGFENDPADSDVAQRFARQVLRSDEIVRENDPLVDPDNAGDADNEIDALVAIPLYIHDRFHGAIVCANRPGGFDEVEDDVLLALGDHAGAALHQGQLHNELDDARRAAIRALLEAMAARDLRLHQESTGLTLNALVLARDLELDPDQRDVLVCATLLRHVGYLAVPDRLLSEPRSLRPDERAVVELHPRVGFNIVGQVPALRDVAASILYHQERFDGTGYPAGLAGDRVPLIARALSVLEAYAAMTNDRPYRGRRSPEAACDEIIAGAGTQFDPEIAQLFVEEIRSGPLAVDEALADALIDALPLSLGGQAGAEVDPLAAASTDGLTLLGNQRAMHHDLREAADEATADRPFAVVLIQLEDLPGVNEDVSYAAGDHLIQVAARNAQRAAGRCGGRAYRASGRRLAIVAPIDGAEAATEVLNELLTEFAGGSAVRTSMAVWSPGDRAADVLARARESVMRAEP
jgi:HD-GYP domain-containing protein (c-di-GMP phosphodiesterase class II)